MKTSLSLFISFISCGTLSAQIDHCVELAKALNVTEEFKSVTKTHYEIATLLQIRDWQLMTTDEQKHVAASLGIKSAYGILDGAYKKDNTVKTYQEKNYKKDESMVAKLDYESMFELVKIGVPPAAYDLLKDCLELQGRSVPSEILRIRLTGHQQPTEFGIIGQIDISLTGIAGIDRVKGLSVSYEPASAVQNNDHEPFSLPLDDTARLFFKRVRSGNEYPEVTVRIRAGGKDYKEIKLGSVPVPTIIKRTAKVKPFQVVANREIEIPLRLQGDNSWAAGDPWGTLTIRNRLQHFPEGQYQVGIEISGTIEEPNHDSKLHGDNKFIPVGDKFTVQNGFISGFISELKPSPIIADSAGGGWALNEGGFENKREAGSNPAKRYANFESPSANGLVKRWQVFVLGNKVNVLIGTVTVEAEEITYSKSALPEKPKDLPTDIIPAKK